MSRRVTRSTARAENDADGCKEVKQEEVETIVLDDSSTAIFICEAGVEHATSESKPEDFQQPHTPPIDDEIVFISETKAVPDVIIVSDDEDDIIDLTADDSDDDSYEHSSEGSIKLLAVRLIGAHRAYHYELMLLRKLEVKAAKLSADLDELRRTVECIKRILREQEDADVRKLLGILSTNVGTVQALEQEAKASKVKAARHVRDLCEFLDDMSNAFKVACKFFNLSKIFPSFVCHSGYLKLLRWDAKPCDEYGCRFKC